MAQGLRQATGGAWSKLTRFGEKQGKGGVRPDAGATAKKRGVSTAVVWREARDLMVRYRGQLMVGFVLMLVNRLSGLVLPATSKVLIDEVLPQGRADLLGKLALAVLLATAVQAATTFGLSQVMSIAAQRAITELRKSVQGHVLRLPVGYFDSTRTGALISRIMSDAEGIRNLVGTGIVQLAGGLLTAAIALGVLFWLNWQLTALTLLVLLSFGAVMAVAFSRLRPIFRERGAINAEVSGRLAESVGGVRLVKTYTAERRERLVFARGVHRLFRNVAATITAVSAVTAVTTVITGFVGVLLIVVGGRSIIASQMTLGDFVMYIFFIGLVAAPLVQIASIGTQVTEAFAGLDRIREVMSLRPEDADDAGKRRVPPLQGHVEFVDVSFAYEPGVPVLRDIAFATPAGSTTALVGSSGSGKSTLLSLVLAFNRPQSGRVLVDGMDLETLRLHDYRSQLGVVLQDNFLFDGTIAENIAFSKPDATRGEILAAAHLAHCDEFTDRFAEGLDTVVGERGVKLSGGQRQRVAIARAILANPRILILDEATSSLDSESEALIRDGLRRLRQGRTTFVIAHRLSTIASADQILVLEEGRIVERGTQEELLALRGRYRQLYETQYGLETDRFINPGEDFTPEPDSPRSTVGAPASRGAL
jgi:subfamily B ATP-binding cassette protein MsbA